MKKIIQILPFLFLISSCDDEKRRSFDAASIEKIYFEIREHEVIFDFEENIEYFLDALNTAKIIGECKFFPKAWVTIETKDGKSTVIEISKQTFKLDDKCYFIDERYDLEFLNQNSRIFIKSVSDIIDLKKKGIGFSTFDSYKNKYKVEKPLRYFGSYKMMDTTEINEIQYLGQINVMTDTNLKELQFENEEEQVVSFETTNERFYFGKQIGIGFEFDPSIYNDVDTIKQNEFQFEKDGINFIVRTDFNKIIIHITAGKFEHKL